MLVDFLPVYKILRSMYDLQIRCEYLYEALFKLV